MPPTGDWRAALAAVHDAALAAVLEARVTVVIGASDAGKTTLVAALASELAARGERVGVVDSDVGQSEIGPPTTVGLGRIATRVARLSGAELIAFQFVGVTSPARDIPGVVEAARRMVHRARAERFDRVLVDTSGLVLGWPGHRLKQEKIAAVDPDLLLFLEREDECAPIAERYAGASRPHVLRLPAQGRPGSRSQIARRQHRIEALDAYLRDARSVSVARSAVELPRGLQGTDVVGGLCGLDDADGNTIALGLVEEIAHDTVRVLAPLPRKARVARVRVGHERKDGTPLPRGVRYAERLAKPGHTPEGEFTMKLEGSYDIPVPRERVYAAFLDPEILRQAIPGCEKLEAMGNDEYKATMKIGVAAVKGTFEGKVRLFDQHPPESYRMAVEGSGGPGFIRGETQISLGDASGSTRVTYTADMQVGGLIAGVGQRMIGGVSKMMADQFFTKMGQLLQSQA